MMYSNYIHTRFLVDDTKIDCISDMWSSGLSREVERAVAMDQAQAFDAYEKLRARLDERYKIEIVDEELFLVERIMKS